MDLLRNYLEWVFSQGGVGTLLLLGLTVTVAVFTVLIAGNVIIWTMVGIKRLFGGHLPTDEELEQMEIEQDARHEAKKAELAERLKAAKAARAAQRQARHRT